MNNLYVEDLRELYQQGRLIPFVGAGVSMSVAWNTAGGERNGPSWREFVNQAARMLGFDNPELLRVRGTDLQILEYFKIKKGGFAELTNWLYSNMQPSTEALKASQVHEQLASMARSNLFYTTNYDDFLEQSFKIHGRTCRRIASEVDMGVSGTGETDGICEIVKFHGDLNSPDQLVISESHYEQRLQLSTVMDYRFRADILGRAVLFLGYSFRDWNVSYLFRSVNEQFKQLPNSNTGRRAYITVADPSDFEYQLFRARNIGVIAINGKNQTEELVKLLQQIRG